MLAQKTKTLKIKGARERFAANTTSSMVYMLLRLVLGMWYTPFLIKHLGIAAFGIISLANSVVIYLEILTTGFNSAVTRFLTIDLNRQDHQSANKTFNTALFSLTGLITVLSVLALFLAPLFPRFFDVPSGFELDASWLFVATVLAFGTGVVISNFAVSSFVHSRFVARNALSVTAMLSRIGLIVLLFSFLQARLWHVGLGMLLTSGIETVGHYVLWRRLTPELRIQPQAFDRTRLRPLLGMGGWVVLNRIGVMLLKNVDLIIVNGAFGAVAAGGYGAVLQITNIARSLVDIIGRTINPAILSKYAQGDAQGLRKLALQSTKLMGLSLALPFGLICGFSGPFLSMWLGPSFENLSPLVIAMVAHLGVNLSIRPLLYIQTAYNRVRWPGVATLVAGAINMALATTIAAWGGWGALGVAVAGIVAWSAKNALYMPIYTARIMKLNWYTFFPSLIVSAISILGVILGAYGLTLAQMPTNWLSLGVSAAVVSLAYVGFVSLFFLNRSDWLLLKSIILKRA